MLGLAPSSSYRPHGGMAPNHALHLTGALTDSEHRQVSADRWCRKRTWQDIGLVLKNLGWKDRGVGLDILHKVVSSPRSRLLTS